MSRLPNLNHTCLLGLCLLLAGSVARSHAQDVTEVTLKGAFLFNFARFTEWPANALPPDGPLSACVVGDRPVGEALAKAVRGKTLGRRTVLVTVIPVTGALPHCHLLYLPGPDTGRVAELVATVRDAPVLTVSDAEAFTRQGGIIQFFIDRGKMRFRINAAAARRARLQLSSRLLALADVVEQEIPPVVATERWPLLVIPSHAPLTAIRSADTRLLDRGRPFTAHGRH